MTGRTARELAADRTDPTWRQKYVDFCDLIDILGDCIIRNGYTIPDDLNAAIALSPAGITMKDKLIRKGSVPPKEAQLMCALTIGHAELFVDIESTDLTRLEASIHRQLIDKEFRFPFIYGRQLYDSYAALFDDEKDVLTVEETHRLLDTVPAGVFQYGRYVLGPYGLRKSLASRSIEFSGNAPAYHCSQPVCHAVHQVRLTTAHDAPINLHREKLRRMLEEEKGEPAEWGALAQEITSFTAAFYGDQRSGTVIALVGDCLSLDELRMLVRSLLDETKGDVRRAVSDFLTVENASDAVADLERDQLLQITQVAREEAIGTCLDRLVRDESIVVPNGEIRRPVVNERSRSGAFRFGAELGRFGVRFVSADPGFASLRERRLLDKLYIRDSSTDTEELDWQLRGFEAEDLDERLEDFFRSTDPRAALKRMILARKTNMIAACEDVGIQNGETLSDDELVETVLWKLGFDVHLEEDPHKYFWDLHQRISALTQSSRISGIGDSETFRGVATSYFAQLEGLLLDCLAYSSWALTTDHTTSASPFSYDNEMDRNAGLERLQTAHLDSKNEIEQFDFTSEKVDLYSLIRGFGILADELTRLESQRENLIRPVDQMPDYAGKTDLKSFLFTSTIPYLDLTDASRKRLIDGLRKIGVVMLSVEVNQVRNDYSHYRRTSPEVERMARALEAIGVAVRQIENLGIARMLCWPNGSSYDAWGRSRHEFAGPRSIEHMFARPSSFDWMGLPPLGYPQYLMRGANLAEPNEILRFTRRFDSEFSRMWLKYPVRRQRGQEVLSTEGETPSHPEGLEMSV
jgi:hypothetical protein